MKCTQFTQADDAGLSTNDGISWQNRVQEHVWPI